ncbi:hypothetical protein [Saccharopolyspora sp. ASAGF58]|uniref:hypothetical protein n=1 Tax=Saccharopolyspora sp. ASAGF58 TaxID=2719023 RepID=UPI00144707F0|nr:hypothetical protein [Saccharopolyspora sp. ASAGF58]
MPLLLRSPRSTCWRNVEADPHRGQFFAKLGHHRHGWMPVKALGEVLQVEPGTR